ncbi:MAG: TonB-dependent receptor plug domain-containing protein, partial [Opitutaceae bacterium]
MSNIPRLFRSGRCYRIVLAGVLGALLPSLQAQTAPAATRVPTAAERAKYDRNGNGVLEADEQAAFEAGEKSDAIVLTPFEVNTSQDRGYAAGNTLAGGRINTPLDLSPSSIQVINKEFMDDFGITDFADAAKWTMNVDVPAGNDAPFGGSRFEYNVRGAGGGGNYPMRDGIPQYFVADSYNSERFEVVSGPNSGMAGLGNSGGMAGSNSKRVRFDNRAGSVSLRGDNFGGYRGTL